MPFLKIRNFPSSQRPTSPKRKQQFMLTCWYCKLGDNPGFGSSPGPLQNHKRLGESCKIQRSTDLERSWTYDQLSKRGRGTKDHGWVFGLYKQACRMDSIVVSYECCCNLIIPSPVKILADFHRSPSFQTLFAPVLSHAPTWWRNSETLPTPVPRWM